MSQVFHDIEKKIIRVLKESPSLSAEKLEEMTQLSPDQIRRGIEWLRLKDIVNVQESQKTILRLDKNGIKANLNGLPERRLLNILSDKVPKDISDIQKQLGGDFGPAMGIVRKNNWIKKISPDSNKITINDNVPSIIPEEDMIKQISETISLERIKNRKILTDLIKRPNFIIQNMIKSKTISLAPSAKNIELQSSESDAIDVEAESNIIHPARTHPLKEVINEIREVFTTLGFTEILGSLAQSSFWNFDALFTPQDHPAREMQDTFFLKDMYAAMKGMASSNKQVANVSSIHRKNWRYLWDINEARKMVLRTHTTCVTIKYLAENNPEQAQIFSLGRVFRNEKVSYKHLVEFNQVEGIVIGKNITLRDLMGIQKEFYKRIGITKIKFWPTFFPYTEPSLQTMVYNDQLKKWVELFGMGIFRPEVTKPLGISKPVLAWGGGIERIAMLKYGIDDVREFYNNNLGWLRGIQHASS